jgi:hypothetical protein
MTTPEEWFNGLGKVTRAYFVVSVGTTIASVLGVIPTASLYLDWGAVWFKFEVGGTTRPAQGGRACVCACVVCSARAWAG